MRPLWNQRKNSQGIENKRGRASAKREVKKSIRKSAGKKSYEEQAVDLKEVQKKLDNGTAILLDVREQKEWDEAHLSSARLVPLSRISEKIPDDLPKDKIIYTHCRRGGRAEQAAGLLKTKYENVIALKYSFEELKKVIR